MAPPCSLRQISAGRYPKLLAKTDVLIHDDWGLAKLTAEQRRDLPEVVKDSRGARPTLATSQSPIEQWHYVIGCPTPAAVILDRLAHNAYYYSSNMNFEHHRDEYAVFPDNTGFLKLRCANVSLPDQ